MATQRYLVIVNGKTWAPVLRTSDWDEAVDLFNHLGTNRLPGQNRRTIWDSLHNKPIITGY